MARTAATVEDLQEGTLPPICAKTGTSADTYATLEFTSTPSWTWILLLFGFFPFLIARAFSSVRIEVEVPMSNRALRRAVSYQWFYRILFGVGIIALALGVIAQSSLVALAGAITVLVGLVVMTVGWPLVWPTARVDGEWVFLSFVHPRFATAVDRRYGSNR